MLRLLSWLWNGHHHDWVLVESNNIVSHSEARKYDKDRVVIGTQHVYRCSVCSKMKKVEL